MNQARYLASINVDKEEAHNNLNFIFTVVEMLKLFLDEFEETAKDIGFQSKGKKKEKFE